jgi:hypothetical protein
VVGKFIFLSLRRQHLVKLDASLFDARLDRTFPNSTFASSDFVVAVEEPYSIIESWF